MPLPPAEEQLSRWQRLWQSQWGNIKVLIIALVVALTVRVLIAEPRFIPSNSMDPTLHIGDRLIVDKISYRWEDPPPGRHCGVYAAPPAGGVWLRPEPGLHQAGDWGTGPYGAGLPRAGAARRCSPGRILHSGTAPGMRWCPWRCPKAMCLSWATTATTATTPTFGGCCPSRTLLVGPGFGSGL